MKEEFIKKYNNHEYISNDLYLNVLENYSGAVPSNFNIDTYNDIVLEKLYLLNKDYFDNFYKDIDSNIKYLGLIFCLQYLHFPPKNI